MTVSWICVISQQILENLSELHSVEGDMFKFVSSKSHVHHPHLFLDLKWIEWRT